MIDYTAILSRKFPNSEWTLNGDDYDGLVWLSDDEKPSQSELDSAWPSIQQQIKDEAEQKIAAKNALLEKLGLTAEEVAILLG
jgi:hypothetical protein